MRVRLNNLKGITKGVWAPPRNPMEYEHINLRTRIKRLMRRTICFSKTTTMHDLVIGLFIKRYEFGVAI
jgi:IS1 family transposase